MKRFLFLVQIWLVSLLVCATLVTLCFVRLDVPVAERFWTTGRFLSPLGEAFDASVLLSIETLVALFLIVTRVVRGHLSRFAEVLALACLASICTYGINDEVLKPLFGVPMPAQVMQGARHAFNFLMGAGTSSFPSGHMILASAFAGVFMRLHRLSIWPLAALLVLAAVLLVVGDWHFVSDVIAGTFVGISAGILAGELWSVHSKLPQ